MNTNDTTITMRVPKELKDRLMELAKQDRRTLTNYLIQLILKALGE